MTGLFFLLMNGTTGAKQRMNEMMLWCDVVGTGGRGQAEIAGAARRDAVAASAELFLLLLPHLSPGAYTPFHIISVSQKVISLLASVTSPALGSPTLLSSCIPLG